MAKKEVINNDLVTLRVGETAADILDEALDVTEQTLDIIENTAERVVTVTKNNPLLIAGALVLGLGIGGLVAYKIAEKRLSARFDEELTEQIAAARAFTTRLAKEGEFESPESAVQALIPEEVVEAVNSYQGRERKVPYNNPADIVVADPRPAPEVVVEEVQVTNNVFVQAATDPRDWDYNLEVATREENPDLPYVVSFDEFHENEPHHEQVTLAYYVEDDTLADERDQPIDNTDYTVGDHNLLRFGHGSQDSKVVYVRNEKISMDFEIIRSMGSYAREVLGQDTPSLRHSQRHPNRINNASTPRKFRGTDE